jgi:hypothetical protein
MGQIDSLKDRTLKVRLRVAAPSWIFPRRALLFLNGQSVAEKKVPAARANRPTDTWLEFVVDRPRHDAHLVCVVLGDGASHPSWKTEENFTMAATNPVYLDTDGDGHYSSPRETARRLLTETGQAPANRWAALEKADEVIAVQMASLLRETTPREGLKDFDQRVRKAALNRPLLDEFVKAEPAPIKIQLDESH